MKRILLITMWLSGWAFGQNCDTLIYDQANILKGHEQEITQAALGIVNEGGDPKILTVMGATNLDAAEKQVELSCSSWRGATGNRKTTLIVLAVSPDTRKLGVYYGESWKHALDDHWNRIKQDYMVPHFREKDWTGGFLAAEEQFGKRLAAAKDESLHPAQTTVVNQEQATDFSGFWKFLMWTLGICTGFGLLLFWWQRRRDRQQETDRISMAQQAAIGVRNSAVRMLKSMDERTKDAVPSIRKEFEDISERYSQIAGYEKNNPETEGLSAEVYAMIENSYVSVIDDLTALRYRMTPIRKTDGSDKTVPTEKPRQVKPQETPLRKVDEERSGPGNTVFAPVLIGNEFGTEQRRERVYDEPVRSVARDDDEGERGGGGSSGWDSSSDRSDSGGSSGFDFGGGGGGGSSDF